MIKKTFDTSCKDIQFKSSFRLDNSSFVIIFFSILLLWTLFYYTNKPNDNYHLAHAFRSFREIKPHVNNPPITGAGPKQTVNETVGVVLLGAAADPDPNDKLSYLWKQIQGPTVVLKDSNASNPTFTAPAVSSGTLLKFSLTVKDDKGATSPNVSILSILVKQINHKPVANAGLNQSINAGYVATLDGSKSRDPDNDTIIYSWMQIGGPRLELNDTNKPAIRFTTPKNISAPLHLVFKLAVTDDKGLTSTPDIVNLTIIPSKPTENAKWLTYENTTYGMSIKYPPNWNASSGYNMANDTDIYIAYLYSLSNNDEGEVQLHVKTLNNTENLSEYVSNEISSYTDQKVIGLDTNVTLAGLPAYRLMYTHPQEGDPNIHWKHLQIGTIVKDKVYYIDYSNPGFFPSQFDLDLPTIQKMISSFEIKAQSANTSSCDSGYNEGVYRAKHDLQGLNGHGYDPSIRHGNLNFQFCYKRGYESVWSNISKQKSTGN